MTIDQYKDWLVSDLSKEIDRIVDRWDSTYKVGNKLLKAELKHFFWIQLGMPSSEVNVRPRASEETLDSVLDRLGWTVDPHGHWNQKGEMVCACDAGEQYKKAKDELKKFILKHL